MNGEKNSTFDMTAQKNAADADLPCGTMWYQAHARHYNNNTCNNHKVYLLNA